ncbi:MAG TPA: Uma2 family endonuclease [Tepidisphaeraceae bacterium]|nr:Uma2 family endonuclease [Tepidisphaeraceae bacterium]
MTSVASHPLRHLPVVATPSPPSFDQPVPMRFTVENVQVMIHQGIIPEDATTELLGGLIVLKDRSDLGGDPLMHGLKHSTAVRLLTQLAGKLAGKDCHAQIQLPVVCGEDELPEPDFSILRGGVHDYVARLPAAADVLTIIEVADSSFERDSRQKAAIYSKAGIPQYLIVNLRNSTVEQYTDPDAPIGTYRTKATFTSGQTIRLHLGAGASLEVAVAELLP